MNGLKFRRQHAIGNYVADFYCPALKLIVEIDGDVHILGNRPAKDLVRERYLQNRGLKVVRVTNNNIRQNMEGVLEHLTTLTLALSLQKGRGKKSG